jgi:hypothetical protein
MDRICARCGVDIPPCAPVITLPDGRVAHESTAECDPIALAVIFELECLLLIESPPD